MFVCITHKRNSFNYGFLLNGEGAVQIQVGGLHSIQPGTFPLVDAVTFDRRQVRKNSITFDPNRQAMIISSSKATFSFSRAEYVASGALSVNKKFPCFGPFVL